MTAVYDESWIFAPQATPGSRVELDPVESTHLVRVLRLACGTLCTVVDGRGSVLRARVELADPRCARLECLDLFRRDPQPSRSLAQAVLKNRGMEDVLDLCAQTPLREFQPLWTEHVQVPRNRDIEHQMRRLQAKAVAAIQQSKQSWLCHVLPPAEIVPWLQEAVASGRPVAVCDPAGAPKPPEGDAWIVVGPEGGFSGRELEAARTAKADLLSLGPSRLRAIAAGFWALAKG